MKRNMMIVKLMGKALVLCLLSSCSVIDEDLDACGTSYELDYELRLVTNMTTELETQLTTQTDITLSNSLRTHLSNIFSDFAHDVDLSFYDTQGDSTRLQHDEHIMNANQASYTLYLPMRQYMHLAAANVVNNELVTVTNDKLCHKAMLSQAKNDTIDSHSTGLFTTRQAMEVLEGVDQTFNVHLYMANCAATLFIDPKAHVTAAPIQVYSTGFATGFNICDSAFQYSAQPPIVRTTRMTSDETNAQLFCSVTFPSKEISAATTRTVIDTEEPFISGSDANALWEFHVYVPQTDGTTTKTILYVKEPLRAGQLKIIKCWLDDSGAVMTQSPEVSTSVTLNWKEGLEIEN